jgi:hypothetical protein
MTQEPQGQAVHRMLEVADQRREGLAVALGGALHESLLAVGAAPSQHIQPGGVVQPDELGPQQLRAQPLGLGDSGRADLQ